MNTQQFEDLCTLYGLTCEVREHHASLRGGERTTTVFICRPYYGSLHAGWFYADIHPDVQIIAEVKIYSEMWLIRVPTWK